MHDITTGGHHHEPSHEHRLTADGESVPVGTRIDPGTLWSNGGERPRRLWIDASQGASGDMLLGALLDAGADAASVARVLEIIAPGKLHLQWRKVQRGPFAAMKVDVIADEPEPPARHLADVKAMLEAPEVPERTRELALEAFRRLAKAEATVHGSEVEEVHFHEVGALDSIGDIVGVCEAVRTLSIEQASSSVVALGSGTVQTQHGLLTVPPPAVVELSRGWEVEAGGPPEAGELCTPTGLTLIRTLCDAVEDLPRMTMRSVGVGAGSRVREDRAGVLRAFVGETVVPKLQRSPELPSEQTPGRDLREVSSNVDDLDPRLWPAVIDRLLDAGAVDAWLVPIIMKKGRPAHTITALTPADAVSCVADALITHTSTIGVRITAPMHRRVLERVWVPVEIAGVSVRIKISGDGPNSSIQQA
ncbi:MAG: nickel pincer cofactor biosynthesis protein LarC, partial [Propionibacterium sp.]|nr:nickel pincer cofactor biosynthesis protein LarC [Propionibacterium sp.]